MKKTAIIAAVLFTMGASAQAFDCAEGGFSVNDKKAVAIFQSQKSFGLFFDDTKQSSATANMISCFDGEDVKKATEQELSATRFEELYKQMELLQRSQLKLDRKPVDLVDLEKYAKAQLPGSLVIYNTDEKYADIKPELRIDKLGKQKAITYTYYLKENENISGMSNSFLMANDHLYILTTLSNLEEKKVEKTTEEKTPEAGKKLKEFKTGLEEPKEPEELVKPLEASEVSDAQKKALWAKQQSFIKSVTFKAPCAKQESFGFQEPYYGRKFNLPEDWAYTQLRISKNGTEGYINIAGPLSTIRYATNDSMKESFSLYVGKKNEALDNTMNEVLTSKHKKGSEEYELAHNYLEKLEQLVVTASFNVGDKELAAMLSQPLLLKTEGYGFLKPGLDKIKNNPTEYFKLNDYTLDIKAEEGKALLDLGADVTALENINLTGSLKAAAKNNAVILLLFAKQKELQLNEILEKSLKDWQF